MTSLFLLPRDEIAEAASSKSVSMAATKGEEIWISVPFSDVEMVRMLFGKSLKPFHKVRKRA